MQKHHGAHSQRGFPRAPKRPIFAGQRAAKAVGQHPGDRLELCAYIRAEILAHTIGSHGGHPVDQWKSMIMTGFPNSKSYNRYLPLCMQITGWPVKFDCYFSSGSEKCNRPDSPGGTAWKRDGLRDEGRVIQPIPGCGTNHRRALYGIQDHSGTGRWSLH